MTDFFPVRIKYTDPDDDEEFVIDHPSELQSGRPFVVLETNVAKPLVLERHVYRQIAGRILYKVLETGTNQFEDTVKAWVEEYADVLDELYPDTDNYQPLYDVVREMSVNGIVVRFNINGAVDDQTEDLLIIEE